VNEIRWSPNRYGTSSVVHPAAPTPVVHHAANTPVAQPVAHAISHDHHNPASDMHDYDKLFNDSRIELCQDNVNKLYVSIKELADTFNISTHGINNVPEARRVLDEVKKMKGMYQSHAESSSHSVLPRVLPKVIPIKPHAYRTF